MTCGCGCLQCCPKIPEAQGARGCRLRPRTRIGEPQRKQRKVSTSQIWRKAVVAAFGELPKFYA
jgi:hypothetical protein